jgi:hypothetical protein
MVACIQNEFELRPVSGSAAFWSRRLLLVIVTAQCVVLSSHRSLVWGCLSSVAWGVIGGLRVGEPQAARRVSD